MTLAPNQEPAAPTAKGKPSASSMTATLSQNKKSYVLDGRGYPRLTNILKSVGIIDFSLVPQKHLEFARERGRCVHKATELYDLGTLDEDTLDPILIPFLEGYKKAKKELSIIPKRIEEICIHKDLHFGCRIDREGLLLGKSSVWEIKSGHLPYWTEIQVAAQILALNDGPRTAYGIELRDDGGYSLHTFKGTKARDVFYAALACYHYKKTNGG